MSVFSKPIKPIDDTNENNSITSLNADNKANIFVKNKDILKINDFFENNIDLQKYKLKDLKPILKYYKLKITGNKINLIYRITHFFKSTKSITMLQSWWRKQLVLMSFKLRGPALKERNLCTNIVDFNTLDKITEINSTQFFSYTGDDNFTYGFDFTSLIELLNRETNPFNPFNREIFKKNTIDNILKLYRITNILFNDNNKKTTTNFNLHSMDIPNEYANVGLSFQYFRPKTYNKNTLKTLNHKNMYIKICKNRIDTLNHRIENIFYKFDEFGNYTQINWFNGLTFGKLVSFYRQMNDIWNSRTNVISNTIKRKICLLYEPFQLLYSRPITYNQTNHDESLFSMRILCVTLMENMIMQGVDEEYSKIGALHCLTSLTVVSHAARVTMPWLYESIR